jgi:hypothetical protein
MTPDNDVVATQRKRALEKLFLLAAAIAIVTYPAVAQERPASMPANAASAAGAGITIPGTSYQVLIGASQLAPDSTVPRSEMVAAIATWISSEFDLPAARDLPRIAFASPDRLVMLHYGGIHAGGALYGAQVVAVYDDKSRTIYLPDTWAGSTAAELSMLVHEMVHHVQNEAGQKFACAEERESVAYAAQQQWLAMFGRDFFQEFETDAFTLLVRTNCGL